MSLNDYFQKHIFEPLGIKNISLFPTRHMKDNLVQMHSRAPDGTLKSCPHILRNALTAESADQISRVFNSAGGGLFATPTEYCRAHFPFPSPHPPSILYPNPCLNTYPQKRPRLTSNPALAPFPTTKVSFPPSSPQKFLHNPQPTAPRPPEYSLPNPQPNSSPTKFPNSQILASSLFPAAAPPSRTQSHSSITILPLTAGLWLAFSRWMRALRAVARERRIGLGCLTCIGGVIERGALRGWWRRRLYRLEVCVCVSDSYFSVLFFSVENGWGGDQMIG